MFIMMNFEKYRQETPYEGVYKYVAPEGYHWQCMSDNFGKVIWGGINLYNPYVLQKDKDYEEMDNNNTINDINTNDG